MALKAVKGAPLIKVADLAGKTPDALIAQLNVAGIPVKDPQDSLAGVTSGIRELEAQAIRTVFARS